MWEIKITHEGLHAFRNVRGATRDEAETKARLQLDAWNARWKRIQDTAKVRQERLSKRDWLDRQSTFEKRAKQHALELTKDAESVLAGLRELLSRALAQSRSFNWEDLKDNSVFEKIEPPQPVAESSPPEPSRSEPQFTPLPYHVTIKTIDWLIPGARRAKLTAAATEESNRNKNAQLRFEIVHSKWKTDVDEIAQRNYANLANYEKAKAAWTLEKRIFAERQNIFNSGIDEFKKSCIERAPEALIRYWTEVLSKSEYPDSFPRDQVVSFDPANGMLVIDYELPPQKSVPNTKHVKYIADRQEFQNVLISDAEFKRI